MYNKKQLLKLFPQSLAKQTIPFDLIASGGDNKERIMNSEMKFECWFIENPVTKELTKRITLKLGPSAQQDFIIVVRSPQLKRPQDMLSVVNVGLLTYAEEKFGLTESFEDFLKYEYGNSMKQFLYDRKNIS